MSVAGLLTQPASLASALQRIAARAGELDREPRFPTENVADLAEAGALGPGPGGLAREAGLVRSVAAADASTARILDGHLNGLERLALNAPEPLREAELEPASEGRLLLGVWGADPAAGEGDPARLHEADGELVLRGVKTFCSGAGGVHRALVPAFDDAGERRLAYVETTSRIVVDRDWYRASGLRASESHRVEFLDARVLALLGDPGELSRQPYFARDGIRTSATWAGLADRILAETLAGLDPDRLDPIAAHLLGQMRLARGTIERWLEHATHLLDDPAEVPAGLDPAALGAECRIALSDGALAISAHAARLGGSRALIGASALDRARRDLDLFVRQHRLDPRIAELGRSLLAAQER